MEKDKKYTAAGTNIETVKQSNEQSGMSYNEAKEYIARTSGGSGTAIYSDTNAEQIRKQNQKR